MHRALALVAVVSAGAMAAPSKTMSFGMSQPYGEAHAKAAKALLEPYLSKATGKTVTVTVYPTYEELSDALASSKVDLAWITPLAFVQAMQKNPEVTALSKAMRPGGGGLYYRSVLVTKKDAPAASVADLKGKKVAWVSKSSTSGYLFARELVRSAGQDPDHFFSGESFAGDHPAACKAVLEGAADVAATFAREPDEGKAVVADGCADTGKLDALKVIASTGNLPNEVIGARPEYLFDAKQTAEVLGIFGKMSKSPEGKKVLAEAFRIDGWGLAVEGDFDPVLALVKNKGGKAKVVKP